MGTWSLAGILCENLQNLSQLLACSWKCRYFVLCAHDTQFNMAPFSIARMRPAPASQFNMAPLSRAGKRPAPASPGVQSVVFFSLQSALSCLAQDGINKMWGDRRTTCLCRKSLAFGLSSNQQALKTCVYAVWWGTSQSWAVSRALRS